METKNERDNINPGHYGAGAEHECIDVMLQQFGMDAAMHFCNLNAFKYLFRCQRKGRAEEDMRKAKWYIDKYLELSTAAQIADNARKLAERSPDAARFEQYVAWKGGEK